jgi:GxxExxY protein
VKICVNLWLNKKVVKKLNEISYKIIGCAYNVHAELGPGLLESTYETCLEYELLDQGLQVERQKPLPVIYKGKRLDAGYRIDLLVENSVIVEIKSVDAVAPIHEAQLLTYLKLSERKLGLLINFNVTDLKKGIMRRVM